jgi:hypothetical protein
MGVIGSARTNRAWGARHSTDGHQRLGRRNAETPKPDVEGPGALREGEVAAERGDGFDNYRHPGTNLERIIGWLKFQI